MKTNTTTPAICLMSGKWFSGDTWHHFVDANKMLTFDIGSVRALYTRPKQ